MLQIKAQNVDCLFNFKKKINILNIKMLATNIPIPGNKYSTSNNVKTLRYTVPDSFLDHWKNKKFLPESELACLRHQWSIDDWDGLEDPPDWLTSDMFTIALINVDSISEKRRKMIKAAYNLETARVNKSTMNLEDLSGALMKDPTPEMLLDYYNRNVEPVNGTLINRMTSLMESLESLKVEIGKINTYIEVSSIEFKDSIIQLCKKPNGNA